MVCQPEKSVMYLSSLLLKPNFVLLQFFHLLHYISFFLSSLFITSLYLSSSLSTSPYLLFFSFCSASITFLALMSFNSHFYPIHLLKLLCFNSKSSSSHFPLICSTACFLKLNGAAHKAENSQIDLLCRNLINTFLTHHTWTCKTQHWTCCETKNPPDGSS